MKTTSPLFRLDRLLLAAAVATTSLQPIKTEAQTVVAWTNTGAATGWNAGTNWSVSRSGASGNNNWTSTDIAQFNQAGPNTRGINFGTTAAGGGSTYNMAAIETTSSRTNSLAISSSSGAGNLVLHGTTLNSVANVILRNGSTFLFTLTGGSGTTTMGITLANTTDNVILVDGTGGITISSIISGDNRNLTIRGDGSGTVILSGNNTFSGTLTASATTTEITGTQGATNVVVNGGILNLTAGDRLLDTAAVSISSGTLGMSTFTDTVGSFAMSGGTLGGSGTLTASTYSLQGGTLTANLGAGTATVTTGTTALNGTLGATTVNVNSGTLTLGSAGRLNTASSLTINGGQLTLGGNETVASLAGSGGTVALGGNTLTVGGGNTSTSFAGAFTGTGGALTKAGNGTLTLTGTSTHTGATTVSSGGLVVDGTMTESAVTVSSGATLGGTGEVGDLTLSGLLAPGNSIGTFSAGNTTFNTGGSFELEMWDWDGAAGTGWDLLAIDGDLTLSLAGAGAFTINLVSMESSTERGESVNFDLTQNFTRTFITFTGNLEGTEFDASLFAVNTLNFQNNFAGTFSVTTINGGLALVYTAAEVGDEFEWDAGSGNWNTAGNWTNNAVPPSTGAKIFYSGAGGLSTNDVVTAIAGLTFNAGAGSYTLEGNALEIDLFGIVNDSSVLQTVDLDLTLVANQSFAATSGELAIGGAVGLGVNTLTVTGGEDTSITGAITGSGGLIKLGSGNLTLGGANLYSGGTLVSAGALIGTTTSLQGGITNNSLVTFDQSTNGTYSGGMVGTGDLTKTGAGNVTLSGVNTFSGAVTINGGRLVLSGGSALDNAAAVSLANVAGVGLDLTANETIASLSGGGATGGSVGLDVNTLTLAGSANTTYSGTISGTGTLAKTGGGTLTFNRASAVGSNFSMRISQGVVDLNRGVGSAINVMFGSGNAVTLDGGILSLSASSGANGNLTLGALNVFGNSTLRINRIGTIAANQTSTLTMPLNFSNNAVLSFDYSDLVTGGTTTFASGGTLFSSGTIDLTNYTVRINNAIGEAGGARVLTKTGAGTLMLAGANTFTGGLSVNGGTVILTNGSALAQAAGVTLANNAGVTLQVAQNETIGSLAGGSQSLVALGGNNLSLASSSSTSFSGDFSGGGKLVQLGTGTITLDRTSAYTSAITARVESGAVRADNLGVAYGFSGGTVELAGAGATFIVKGTANANFPITLAGLDVFANGNLMIERSANGSTSHQQNIPINFRGGQLTLVHSNISGGTITFVGANTLYANGGITSESHTITLSNAITEVDGSRSFTKAGAGVLVFAADNTYTGDTVVTGGELRLSGAGRIGDSSLVNVSSGATVNFNNISDTIKGLAGAGAVSLGTGTVTVSNAVTDTFSGAISGTGGLTKTGSGVQVLTGNNDYTGATTVSSGTLELARSGGPSLGSTASVSVGSGATLLLSASDQVNNSASVTLSGGTITRGSGVSEVFGNLNLTAASFLDFGTGAAGSMEFSGIDYAPSALLTLQLFNFTQGNTFVIRNTTDLSSFIGTGFTFDGDGGFGSSSFSDGTFTITAIPEPSTYAAAAGLLAMMLWPARRRLLKDTKKILGLTPPMRDRLARRASEG